MLAEINIRNFAIIEELSLQFDSGLTVLSGETGAGKSIIIDALGLVLGDRGGAELLRPGSKRCDISAEFRIDPKSDAQQWLEAQSLDDDDSCIVRRSIGQDGRSRGYINGSQATMQQLREIGSFLVDIHGQHEHQSLTSPAHQRELLDSNGNHAKALQATAVAYADWEDCDRKLNAIRGNETELAQRLDYLQYQVQELEQLAPQREEIEALEKEQRKLASADDIRMGLATACGKLDDDDGTLIQLGSIQRGIENLLELAPELAETHELLSSAHTLLEEARSNLRNAEDRLQTDPARLEEIDDRIAALQSTARKHHCDISELEALQQHLSDELQDLQTAINNSAELENRREAAASSYLKAAKTLSTERSKAAAQLGKEITESLQPLGLSAARLEIQISHEPELRWSQHGLDKVNFVTSMNPGQPLRPLAKVASGGELSRLSLAIQVATRMNTEKEPAVGRCMIFDEVDTGIGGAVAEIVGARLRSLGATQQVLCITHLPQVAAHGHQHYKVQKSSSGDVTTTEIKPLTDTARRDELARMLGGIEITHETNALADDMLRRAAA